MTEPTEKTVEAPAQATTTPEPAAKTIEPTKKAEEPVLSKVAVKAETSVSLAEQKEITSTIQNFLTAIKKKNGKAADTLVSGRSKAYFDILLNAARITPRTELLKQDFAHIVGVIIIRLTAASTTLDLKASDIIPQAVALGNSTWLNEIDLDSLGLTFERQSNGAIKVSSKDMNKLSLKLSIIKEEGSWKIDYTPNVAEQNANVEKDLKKMVLETGNTREEIMETLVQIFFGRFNAELNYLIWVPLNERGELKADNAKLQSFTDSPNGWSILFPEHWTIDGVEGTVFFLAPYTTDGIRPSIAVTPNQKPVSTKLSKYIDYILTELPNVKKDITGPVESKETTFHGMPAYRIIYNRLRTFDEGKTYIKQTTDSIIFINDGIAYLVEYRNGIGDFEKTKPLAEKAIDTFRFEKICTSMCISRQ